MGCVVQKYGGTSVGSVERIKHVAMDLIDQAGSANHTIVGGN